MEGRVEAQAGAEESVCSLPSWVTRAASASLLVLMSKGRWPGWRDLSLRQKSYPQTVDPRRPGGWGYSRVTTVLSLNP